MELFTYYGLDWLAMALSLLAVYLLGNKSVSGFWLFIIANAIWIFTGIALMESYGIAAGNAVFLVLNARGIAQWSKTNHHSTQSHETQSVESPQAQRTGTQK